jgi:NADPH:quinone reductase-like Zn-dependent oxidoreductase
VEAVGTDVTRLAAGDEVFGGRSGAFAEYVCARDAVVKKPANVSFEQAAAVPIAGLTALQGLRDKGGLEPGQKVLVNGASGGVGTFAVQIAKALGAEVTAVCSTRNVEQARLLGADHVVDYAGQDFTRRSERYDVLLDVAGNRAWREYKRVLQPQGALVFVGGPKTNRWIGPLGRGLQLKVAAIPGDRRVVMFLAKLNNDDLDFLAKLLEESSVTPVVEKTYELSEAAEALALLGEGHARGKVVLSLY